MSYTGYVVQPVSDHYGTSTSFDRIAARRVLETLIHGSSTRKVPACAVGWSGSGGFVIDMQLLILRVEFGAMFSQMKARC